jgi:sulfofructose kinase
MRNVEILGFGQIVVDLRCFVPHIPGVDEVVHMKGMNRQLGGMVSIAMVAAARLGAKAALASAVGDDEEGRYCFSSLAEVGVDCASMVVLTGRRTPFTVALIDGKTGKRTLIFNRGLLNEVDVIPVPDFGKARFLHLDGHFFPSACQTAELARRAGLKVSLDLSTNERNPDIGRLLAAADYIIVPERFAARHTGASDPAEAARRLADTNSGTVIVTQGEAGSTLLENGVCTHVDAFQVQALDTTGAGDSYHGGFIFALSRGLGAEKAAVFASAVAAIKCSRTGAFSAFPDQDEVLSFLKWKSDELR